MAEPQLPIPIEIPWKLVGTSRVETTPSRWFPVKSTVSVFMYEPKQESLKSDYPGYRIVYFRFSLSFAPRRLEEVDFGELAKADYFRSGLPVYHGVLDVMAIPKTAQPQPYFKLHFIDGAPIRREIVETGVVGAERYEGSSNQISIGKSASQLHESARASSQVSNTDVGVGIGAMGSGIGYGYHQTNTTMDSERTVEQNVDTTQRDASQERRELLSHMTDVKNVLSLMDLKRVGAGFLRYSFWPRPLSTLSVDPTDSNRWYRQILDRRSRGLEGIQDCIAVLAVPEDLTDFEIVPRLNQFSVLDPPSIPEPQWADDGPKFPINWELPLLEYLYRTYPIGTSLEDIDPLLPLITDPAKSHDPVITGWWLQKSPDGYYLSSVRCGWTGYGNDPQTNLGQEVGGECIYKRIEGLWLEMKLAAASRSPLDDDNLVFLSSAGLSVKFKQDSATLKVSEVEVHNFVDSAVDYTPPPRIESLSMPPGPRYRADVYLPVRATIRWNACMDQLRRTAGNFAWDSAGGTIQKAHPKLQLALQLFWAGMAKTDSRNRSLDAVAPLLKLTSPEVQALKQSGVKDLVGLAQQLLQTTRVARFNQMQKGIPGMKPPVPPLLSLELAKTIAAKLGPSF